MNQKNIGKLYQLVLDDDDETLMGSQWEEMYCNEYDTPKSILDKFLDIYKIRLLWSRWWPFYTSFGC